MKLIIDILGDISLTYAQFGEIQSEEIAGQINDVIGDVDYRIGNLESPICLERSMVPIKKSGPNLKMQSESIPFLAKLRVDGYILANNHIGDYGEKGVIDTIKTLEQLNKDYVGSSREYEKTYKTLRKIIKDIKLSFIAVCENEFGIAYNGRVGAAGFDREKVKQVLSEESEWADFKILIFHGGTENYPYPTPEQKDRYHDLAGLGADVVIGMHSHCPQGYEIYQNVPIVYSVGNFFFPRIGETIFETWGYGYIARIKLQKGFLPELESIPYRFDIHGHDFFLIDKKEFLPYLYKLSNVIKDDVRLRNLYRGWAVISGKKYFDSLCKQIITEQETKRNCLAKNLFSCETHRELLKTYLTILYEKDENLYLPYIEEIKKDIRCLDKERETERMLWEADIDTVIWGIGNRAEELFCKLKSRSCKIVFADMDVFKQGLNFCGKEIISPEDAIKRFRKATFYICTSPESRAGIISILKDNGIEHKQIVFENNVNWRTV